MLDPESVRDFLAVAELGSFAEAERSRGIPRSSLSRRIIGLEKHVGVRLIDRNSRKVRLTAEGLILKERAAALLAQWTDLEDLLRPEGAPLSGKLRVSVPVLFGQTLLGRIAATFAAAYPQVFLEVVVDDRHVDLVRDGFDAAVRVNPRSDADLSGRVVAHNELVLVISARLAQSLDFPARGIDEIRWPAVVRPGWGDDGTWDIVADGRRHRIMAEPRLSLSSPLAVRDAVCAGAGAALLPLTLVRSDLGSGHLLELGRKAGPREEIWVVHASGPMPSRRVQAFTKVVEAHLNQTFATPSDAGN